MKAKLLIIGKVPPPIGGVTIHVDRLLTQLKLSKLPHVFISLTKQSIFFLIIKIASFKVVHIHSSNPLVRLYLVLLSRLFGVKSLVTIHGNIGRFGSAYKNLADRLAIKLASKPIVLNRDSLVQAIAWNKNTELISAFIPPVSQDEQLSKDNIDRIHKMKLLHEKLFCTNASTLSFDKNGIEIYGIYELLETFRFYPNLGLIISDPLGIYFADFELKSVHLPANVIMITGEHSYYKVMSMVDGSIRNTSTDGDSLSIKESLHLRKLTFTTDVVERPLGCILYKRDYFKEVLSNLDSYQYPNNELQNLNGYPRLMSVFCSYLNI